MTVKIIPQRINRRRRQLAALLSITVAAHATPSAAQTPTVTIRELGAAKNVSTVSFKLILQIHAFSDGRVLINDGGARRLVLLNKSLAEEAVLLDSLSGTANFYGPRASPVIRYRGDSALFVDGPSSTLLLISPTGKIARTLSLPKPADVRFLAASASGVDARGNLVYRGGPPRAGLKPNAAPTRAELLQHDSIPIVRANFETRVVDTVANLVLPTDRRTDIRTINGQSQTTIFHNPPFVYDDWVVTSEGTIVIVRGSTYRFEMFDADNKRVADAKVPFDWRVFTEADKQHLLDSTRTSVESSLARSAASAETGGSTVGTVGGIALRRPVGPDAAPPIHLWATPAEMISYWPAIRQGAVSADLDGNIWILPASSSAATNGELVYDVVNNKGMLAYRVRLPVGRVIAGFGHGGVIYTSVKQDTGVWMLEQRSIM